MPTHHNISIPIEEAKELLQAPEATAETSQEEFCNFTTIGRRRFQLPLQTHEAETQETQKRNEEGAKGQGTHVIEKRGAAGAQQQRDATTITHGISSLSRSV